MGENDFSRQMKEGNMELSEEIIFIDEETLTEEEWEALVHEPAKK